MKASIIICAYNEEKTIRRVIESCRNLNPNDEIVVYCSTEVCYASISVYHLLVKWGYKNVRRYAGGLMDWEAAGYPLDGEAPRVPAGGRSS